MSDLLSIPTCYATPSAGMHPSHTLPLKLRAIAHAGFKHAELAFPDLEAHVALRFPGYAKIDDAGRGDVAHLCDAAREVRALCTELQLEVLAVHPFSRFEGYTDTAKREDGFARAQTWFAVLKELGCSMLQVGSNDDPASSADFDVIARDLRQLADDAAAQDPPIRIAYEMWAWGAHVNTWEHTWEICKRVARPNFGLCLDTFQICARAYADPTADSWLLPSAPEHLARSLASLTTLFSDSAARARIFYLQVSDGSRKVTPAALRATAEQQGIPPLYAWSNAWRPLPHMDELEGVDTQGFLPVVDVVDAVLRTGWRGPLSYEVFYEEDMARDDPEVPGRWTAAAQRAHKKTIHELEKRL